MYTARYVFMFDSLRGNGIIRTAFMAADNTLNRLAGNNYMAYSAGTEILPNNSNIRDLVVEGTTAYFVAGSHLYIFNILTQELERRTLPENAASTTQFSGSGKNGNFYFYKNASNQLCKLNLTTMLIVARTQLDSNQCFFEANGFIYAPLTANTRSVRKYDLDLNLVDTILTQSSSNMSPIMGMNYDYAQNKLIVGTSGFNIQPGMGNHTIYKVELADFLTQGMNALTTWVFGLPQVSQLFTTTSGTNMNQHAFLLPNGNYLMLMANALIQACKYQGYVGSAILLDEPIEKDESQEMTVYYDIEFNNRGLVV